MKPTNKRKDIWVILGILALLFGSVISYDTHTKKMAKYTEYREGAAKIEESVFYPTYKDKTIGKLELKKRLGIITKDERRCLKRLNDEQREQRIIETAVNNALSNQSYKITISLN